MQSHDPLQALLSMIELDIVGYDMFELPPLSEYELYIKNFGSEDARQVSAGRVVYLPC